MALRMNHPNSQKIFTKNLFLRGIFDSVTLAERPNVHTKTADGSRYCTCNGGLLGFIFRSLHDALLWNEDANQVVQRGSS